MSDSKQHSSIKEAERAFSSGNHAAARELALTLRNSDDPERVKGAEAILIRLSPAPLGKYLLLLTACLLIAVTIFAYSQ